MHVPSSSGRERVSLCRVHPFLFLFFTQSFCVRLQQSADFASRISLALINTFSSARGAAPSAGSVAAVSIWHLTGIFFKKIAVSVQ